MTNNIWRVLILAIYVTCMTPYKKIRTGSESKFWWDAIKFTKFKTHKEKCA